VRLGDNFDGDVVQNLTDELAGEMPGVVTMPGDRSEEFAQYLFVVRRIESEQSTERAASDHGSRGTKIASQ